MIPTRIGQRVPGGHFAGINRIGNSVYAVVISPEWTETALPCKIEWSSTPNTQSVNDGLSNTLAMGSIPHLAAQHCLGLVVDGCNDFYLPAMSELELCYRNLKSDASENYVTSGNRIGKPLHNANGTNLFSVPTGKPYTLTDPTQTIVTAFVNRNTYSVDQFQWHWTSTESVTKPSCSIALSLIGGTHTWDFKDRVHKVRAVRRICIV